jgi:hypothetical protein
LYLQASLKERNTDSYVLAALFTRMGKQEKAMSYLEKACREREADVPRIIRRQEFENLHSNPRFQALVDTMNLRPYFSRLSK